MDLSGQTLGQYQIIEPIGQGGMATVYKANQPNLERQVAIKVLPTQQTLQIPELKQRFIREARAVAQLSHPHILPIYDFGFESDISYYVMKYIPGSGTLKNLLGQPIALPTVGKYIEQISSALDHAHEQNIIHRDIKPANVLLENDWLYLADFGLAKIGMDSQLTTDGMVVGTPEYISPEQAEGSPIDHRADIYSLGIVLYEMIMGQLPYEAESTLGVLYKHVHAPIPRPRRYRRDLPIGIEAIILKALDKDPANRYHRAGELAEALQAQLDPSSPITAENIRSTIPARIFLWYQYNAASDRHLGEHLQDILTQSGHIVSVDHTSQTNYDWLADIDPEIQSSDFLIVLLSKESIESEMARDVLKQGYEHQKSQKRPYILPVQATPIDSLPAALEEFLASGQRITCQNEIDYQRVGRKIVDTINNFLSSQRPVSVIPPSNVLSEDGGTFTDEEAINTPLPQFDPSFLETLDAPGGVVKLRDKFYLERQGDARLKREVIREGTTITIRASRQTGKSSLLVRGVNYARKNGAKVVHYDLQRTDAKRLATPDIFLRDLAELIVRKLKLDVTEVENFWGSSLGPQDKLTNLMEDYVLPEVDTPIVLALDEVDRLLRTTSAYSDFFALLRFWHNSRASEEQWNKFNLVLVISTEPYLLISNIHESPFNVGHRIYLEDFNEDQVRDLNQRHGSPVSNDDFPQLMDLLGGQPYLTRQALYTLTVEQLAWAELRQQAVLDHGPFGEHLRRQQWLLNQEPTLRVAFKQIIEHNTCEDESARFRLLQAGLIKGSGDVYTCRCNLYSLFFGDKL